ncbi:hypothetical protein FNJ87_14230 [Nonlabens mediterrranea]|uniref:Lipoprotein n=1 Tax=Nonlabens mediterrranea TaxID=1419947 RepID=A0ABS0A992_9FLAO|nr:hypothetical protein [Nonlabens mediterrranea]
MKCYQFIIFLLFTTSIISCEQDPKLTAITYDQMMEMVEKNQITIPNDVIYYSLDGKQLSKEQRKSLSNDLPFADWMIDSDSVLVKVQLQDSDKVRIAQKSTPLLKNGARDINCNNLGGLLKSIYLRDQDARADNLNVESIDQNNLTAVEQILGKCGMPAPESVGKLGYSALWLVIQHAGAEERKKYFPMIKKGMEDGLFEKQDVALMEDRMLMDDGLPQLYGSQVLMNADGSYEFYELQDPETVDARRKAMGMGPLAGYLSFFNIEFNIPQQE